MVHLNFLNLSMHLFEYNLHNEIRPIDLFLAEIIPAVTVPPKPKGLPIAITQSPILALIRISKFNWYKFFF